MEECLQQLDIYKGEVDELRNKMVLSSLFPHAILVKPFSFLSKVVTRLNQEDFCTRIQRKGWLVGVDDLSAFYDELIEAKDGDKSSDGVLSSIRQSHTSFIDCFVWFEAENTKNIERVQNEVRPANPIHH